MMPDVGDAPDPVTIKVYEKRRLVFTTELTSTIEIGRQRIGEPEPFCRVTGQDVDRIIVAGLQEITISRQHAEIQLLPGGEVSICNRSDKRSIALDASDAVPPGGCSSVPLPALLSFDGKVIRLEQAESLDLSSLNQPTLIPGKAKLSTMRFADLPSSEHGHVDMPSLIRWLQATMDVLQRAASSPDFLSEAASTAARNISLDSAAVVRWDGQQWKVDALYTTEESTMRDSWKPSLTMLQRVRTEKRTFRYTPHQIADHVASLQGVSALVAAPILDPNGEVIGAIYGDRRSQAGQQGATEISELEAMLVELLACGVAGGLARLEQEKEAMAARVRFEQFFPPELARQLESDPDLLSGRNAEVSVLVCDICGFSRITERLGPARTVPWINDALDALSQCVIDENGVLVDYVGDEVMAMWGAPEPQPDHAARASRAALQMLHRLPDLNQRWEKIVGEPMDLGIGVNAGMAQVGNVGSRCKFKYGPLGNTVNLASRIQGATKHLKAKLLISGSTAAALDSEFPARRLCRVRVVNITEPVDLYELVPHADADWLDLKEHYEAALTAFENQEFFAATRTLGNVLEQHPNDGPTLVLLSRTVQALADPPDEFDSVWELPGK